MRGKFVYLIILGILLICQFSFCLATDANRTTTDSNVTQQLQQHTGKDHNMADANTSISEQDEPTKATEKATFDPWRFLPWIIAGIAAIFGPVIGCIFTVYRYRRRIPEEKEKETAKKEAAKKFEDKQDQEKSETLENRYKKALRGEVGWIKMLGSPEIPNLPVQLLDTFVSLRISQTWRSDSRFDLNGELDHQERERDFTPEQIMQRAFSNRRMLLIIGDPGSGKTTLMKYYAMCCMLPDRYKKLGFDEPPLPIYFPLRQVHSDGVQIALLPKNLAEWTKEHTIPIDEKWFSNQLNESPTLVLLDGLDEISDLELRRRVCKWVDDTAEGLDKAKFVVTSRWTGYRKIERIELGFPHIRADVRDFSPDQQQEFLQKWFCAAFLEEQCDDSIDRKEWEEKQKQLGMNKARDVIDFLREEKNKGVQELAAVPMLLQIIAVIWKEREVLPRGRAELYRIALKYLLDYRDRRRNLDPLLAAEQALRVLCPVSLWMQEELRTDEVDRDKLHKKMQPVINTMDDSLSAKAFCENLRDRAGLIADYGESAYIFRHKSFREYLAALELVEKAKRDKECLKKVVQCFGDDWWDEPLRFFINEANDRIFDEFMDVLFASDVSKELDQKQQNLLHTIVCEAAQVRIDSLVKRLNDGRVHEMKKRYILDCLKVIDKQEARDAVSSFASKEALTGAAGAHAMEIDLEMGLEAIEKISMRDAAKVEIFDKSFRNPFEFNAEYIRIPGGSFEYSVSQKKESVPDIYFAKYPVTNKRYRRFIDYLAGKEDDLNEVLAIKMFRERMLGFAATIDGFSKYLGTYLGKWAEKFRSEYDDDKRFKGDDQPVVGVSWFDAQAYCRWLSLLDAASKGEPLDESGSKYRLPTEIEWELAASGGKRRYPWGDKEPNDKLANYDGNVGATTSVGRYPDGATPEGLMDMAGNVWEWMENWYEQYKGEARSLRGGSWDNLENLLRCSGRSSFALVNRLNDVGFRVVRSQS